MTQPGRVTMCRRQGREMGRQKPKIRRGKMNPKKAQMDFPNKGITERWGSKRWVVLVQGDNLWGDGESRGLRVDTCLCLTHPFNILVHCIHLKCLQRDFSAGQEKPSWFGCLAVKQLMQREHLKAVKALSVNNICAEGVYVRSLEQTW